MKNYTLGFIFDWDLTRVILKTKTRPSWQKGKLNGVGGKLNPYESYKACMIRECREEIGFKLSIWKYIGYFETSSHQGSARVHLFTTRLSWAKSIQEPESLDGEDSDWYNIDQLFNLKVVPNIIWLVNLALICHTHPRFKEELKLIIK